jgi:glycosyltransferase involved in cell wall biosynthesis
MNARATAHDRRTGVARPVRGTLDTRASVLALVPHYRCEEWLGDCLESLMTQTRPLQGIAVIDDASDPPPVRLLREFPAVTLLRASENVGPYRLVQRVIDLTDYDAYLFNDADDWSVPYRLESQLAAAERTGAELVGSNEIRVSCEDGSTKFVAYPEDVNAALEARPARFALMHHTSVVARSLVRRVGGFATGLRFGGDSEFMRRAAHAGLVVNVPLFCYYRRMRSGSLTASPHVGIGSPARQKLLGHLLARAEENAAAVAKGARPVLSPLAVAAPVELRHVRGPHLGTARGSAS